MSQSTFEVPGDLDTTTFDDQGPDLDDAPDRVDDQAAPDLDEQAPAAPGAKASAQRGLPRATIRRIAAKAQEVSETDKRTVAVAASLLGCGTGLAEITTAIMASARSATTPISDLSMIAGSDPMEAGVNAAALGRERIKGVWNLLGSLDAGSKSAMPGANAKAAIAVAKAIFALDEIAKAEIEAVAALLKKN